MVISFCDLKSARLDELDEDLSAKVSLLRRFTGGCGGVAFTSKPQTSLANLWRACGAPVVKVEDGGDEVMGSVMESEQSNSDIARVSRKAKSPKVGRTKANPAGETAAESSPAMVAGSSSDKPGEESGNKSLSSCREDLGRSSSIFGSTSHKHTSCTHRCYYTNSTSPASCRNCSARLADQET